MLGFFNRTNSLHHGVQVLNLIALTYATYDLITNPESRVSESVLIIGIQAINFLSLPKNVDILLQFAAFSLNIVGLGAAYAGMTSGCTGIPLTLQLIQVVNNLVSAGTLVVACGEAEITEQTCAKLH